MFSSIRSRLKSLRRSDPDARIERKARNAEKHVTRTASRDLAQWEERNGYCRPSSSIATNANGSESSKTLTERSRTVSDLRKASSDFGSQQRSRTVSEAKLSADTSFSTGYNTFSHTDGRLSVTMNTTPPTLAPPAFAVPPSSSGATSRLSSSTPRLDLQPLTLASTSGSTLAESMAPFGATQQQQQQPRAQTPATPTTPTVSISNADQTLRELEEKEKLLAEIQKIRASIQDLKAAPSTSTPNLSIDVTTSGLAAAKGSKSQCRLSPVSGGGEQQRQAAPWLTDDRAPRPKSALGMNSSSSGGGPRSPRSPHNPHSPMLGDDPRPTMVGSSGRRRSVADIFAEDAPTPASPRVPTPLGRRASMAPQLELSFASSKGPQQQQQQQQPGPASQAMQPSHSAQSMQTTSVVSFAQPAATARPRTKSTSSIHSQAQGRRRDTWRGEELPPLPTSNVTAAAAAAAAAKVSSPTLPQQRDRDREEMHPPRPKSRTESVYTHGGTSRPARQRQIIDTPEEAKKRYSAALGRSTTPTNGRSATPVNNGRSTPTHGRSGSQHRAPDRSSSAMTMAELQDRHLAKLRQLQSPATAKVKEADAVNSARAEWERRTRLERLEQERKMRERAETSRRSSQQQRPSMPSRRQTMSEDLLRSPAEQLALGTNAEATTAAAPVPAPVTTQRRLSGVRKAREWRKSLVLSEDPRLVALREAEDVEDAGNDGRRNGAAAATPPLPETAAQIAAASRGRAKSTLGLERPTLPRAGARTPATPTTADAMSSSMMPSYPLTHSSVLDGRRNSYIDPMVRTTTPTPNATATGATPTPARPEKHRRQLTVTDIRRMQEGAGRRRSSAKMEGGGGEGSSATAGRRMSQPLLDLETARATTWHPQWTQV